MTALPIDVDQNGEVKAATDGVFVFRSLLGLGDVAPASFRALDPTIPDDSIIEGNIDDMGMGLDVDGNGTVSGPTDGVYVFRRLLGLQTVVPTVFRMLDPSIPPDEVVGANVDALFSSP